jgi:hypothetical protein
MLTSLTLSKLHANKVDVKSWALAMLKLSKFCANKVDTGEVARLQG